MNTATTAQEGTTMRESIKVRSPRTGVTFAAHFPTAEAAFGWIQAHDFDVIECSDDVQYLAYAEAEAGTVYCSICDGIGHGQPGHGPCPLEDRGWMDTFEEEARGLLAF